MYAVTVGNISLLVIVTNNVTTNFRIYLSHFLTIQLLSSINNTVALLDSSIIHVPREKTKMKSDIIIYKVLK